MRFTFPRIVGTILFLALPVSIGMAAEEPFESTVQHIQRSMKAMEEGVEPVRILFYGQSITQGEWRDQLIQGLRERFPRAKLEVESRPIGGFRAPRLEGTAHTDLYPFYPDLLIFHVYGELENYERIIATTRAVTTAEIIMATDHVSNMGRDREEDSRVQKLAGIAEKYDAMLVDIRGKWKAHLAKTGAPASQFLRDKVHPNAEGNKLYAEIMLGAIRRLPGAESALAGQIQRVGMDAAAVKRLPDGAIELTFDGNRVVAICGPGGGARVTVDGKAPSELLGNWFNGRASGPPKGVTQPRPVLTHVGFDVLPVAEDWTLTVLPGSSEDGSEVHFELRGSVTGPDGRGVSTKDFRSTSGRATIRPSAWFLAGQLKRDKVSLREGFQIRWRTKSIAPDTFEPGEQGTRKVLVQGLPNGPHTLRLDPLESGAAIGIESLVVYRPDPGIRIPSPTPDSSPKPDPAGG
jgi:hypothetical protein